jgi:hypothetical protein
MRVTVGWLITSVVSSSSAVHDANEAVLPSRAIAAITMMATAKIFALTTSIDTLRLFSFAIKSNLFNTAAKSAVFRHFTILINFIGKSTKKW